MISRSVKSVVPNILVSQRDFLLSGRIVVVVIARLTSNNFLLSLGSTKERTIFATYITMMYFQKMVLVETPVLMVMLSLYFYRKLLKRAKLEVTHVRVPLEATLPVIGLASFPFL
jgi:hypothetical protein